VKFAARCSAHRPRRVDQALPVDAEPDLRACELRREAIEQRFGIGAGLVVRLDRLQLTDERACRLGGETNPLYLDEAAAKAGPFGGLIAPPSIHILLMFACTPTDDWMRFVTIGAS